MPPFLSASLVAGIWYPMYHLHNGARSHHPWVYRVYHCADNIRMSNLRTVVPHLLINTALQLVWNIFLMCIGRHPLQNPTMIKPEIGRLPKSVVDRIPLVMYIPPPPDASPDVPIKIPEAAYSYPPKSSSAATSPKRRFRFLRFKGKKEKTNNTSPSNETQEGKKPSTTGDPQTWEDHWEQDGYPFVILEGNRAACAICLLDFEEPKRAGAQDPEEKGEPVQESAKKPDVKPTEIQVENITEEERGKELRLQDVGEGAQPLRLLACGHVFHVSAHTC